MHSGERTCKWRGNKKHPPVVQERGRGAKTYCLVTRNQRGQGRASEKGRPEKMRKPRPQERPALEVIEKGQDLMKSPPGAGKGGEEGGER